ncbi:MAG TPA: hypothetical protein VNL94_09930 [Candidatus Binatia bacterium]|nr:hypothetical protein [Candidatus Binatia bacterium]
MARPGGGERRRKVAVDTIAQPDEHARGQPGLRLRHRAIQAGGREPPHPLHGAAEAVLRPEAFERLGAQRAHGADAPEVRAVVVLGRRADPTRDLDAVARHDRRVPRQRRRHEYGRAVREPQGERGRAVALAR